MENSKKMNDFSAGEPQVLRKAEIARILNTVKQAPFNADNSKNSENKSFKKRSLLDIALNSAKDDNSEVAIDKDIDQTQENLQNENTSPENNETPEIINEADSQNNFDEENKKQLIEENNALIEERIKKAEQDAFLKGKEEGLEEGKLLGISEARAQSQEGLDAAISVFRIAAETIDSSDQSNLDVLNDTIQRSVLSIAQESAGFIIDTLPEKFISRINELSKLINENIKKISLDMNSEDYAIIKEFIEKDEFLSSGPKWIPSKGFARIKVERKNAIKGELATNYDQDKVVFLVKSQPYAPWARIEIEMTAQDQVESFRVSEDKGVRNIEVKCANNSFRYLSQFAKFEYMKIKVARKFKGFKNHAKGTKILNLRSGWFTANALNKVATIGIVDEIFWKYRRKFNM